MNYSLFLLFVIAFGLFTPVTLAMFDNLNIFEFSAYKETYKKSYQNKTVAQEHEKYFDENIQLIKQHNKLFARGRESFKMGINLFSDMSPSQMDTMTNCDFEKSDKTAAGNNELMFMEAPDSDGIPDAVNWVEKGAVSPVKAQLNCGSCWAFATTGAVESQYFIRYGKMYEFSQQQLVDCVDHGGCNGGKLDIALDYMSNRGIGLASEYPYRARKGVCKKIPIVAKIDEYFDIGGEVMMKNVIAKLGPIPSAIYAMDKLKYYKSGIFFDYNCTADPTHAILVVGYGTFHGIDYWLIKNSWGVNWGDKGYFKLARNASPDCNIGKYPRFVHVVSSASKRFSYNHLSKFVFFVLSYILLI